MTQKEPLGCVEYLHWPTNDSYNICLHSCCLPCNYVTKPFGILQRVLKSQRVYIYHLDSAKDSTFSLRKVNAAKFSEIQISEVQIFRSNEKVPKIQTISICSFQERNVSFLSIWGNVITLQTAHRNFLILCQIVSHSNINFLISKQNKAPKIDPKMLKR